MINLLIINSTESFRTKLFSDTPAKIDLASSISGYYKSLENPLTLLLQCQGLIKSVDVMCPWLEKVTRLLTLTLK